MPQARLAPFRFAERWQGPVLSRLLSNHSDADALLAVLEERDQQLERYLSDQAYPPWVIAWLTAAADATTFGTNESGPAGSTYSFIQDDGTTGSGNGYPQVTIETKAGVMIIWSARPLGIAGGATYRSNAVVFNVLYDGLIMGQPSPQRQYANSNSGPVDLPITAMTVRRSLAPGPHTFQLVANWNDNIPAAVNQPRLTDGFLAVLPIG